MRREDIWPCRVAARIHEGVGIWSNRSRRTLLDKLGALLA